MKKIILSLSLFIFLINIMNAQTTSKITKEVARKYSTDVLIQLKNSLKGNYTSSGDFNDFLKSVYGKAELTKNQEGLELLRDVHYHLHKKTTDDDLYRSYDGKSVAKAFKFMVDKNDKDGSLLFNVDINQSRDSDGKKCKWWQLRCWLTDIVGEEAADIIITALIALLL